MKSWNSGLLQREKMSSQQLHQKFGADIHSLEELRTQQSQFLLSWRRKGVGDIEQSHQFPSTEGPLGILFRRRVFPAENVLRGWV